MAGWEFGIQWPVLAEQAAPWQTRNIPETGGARDPESSPLPCVHGGYVSPALPCIPALHLGDEGLGQDM